MKYRPSWFTVVHSGPCCTHLIGQYGKLAIMSSSWCFRVPMLRTTDRKSNPKRQQLKYFFPTNKSVAPEKYWQFGNFWVIGILSHIKWLWISHEFFSLEFDEQNNVFVWSWVFFVLFEWKIQMLRSKTFSWNMLIGDLDFPHCRQDLSDLFYFLQVGIRPLLCF